ncbi:MAG: hypothetical protein A4E58_02851 [Syntrophorhabdus sp. PtaB.Bin006]|nr:MAG: hypothetical protein A4E58_02851 [Syntrophorhabdus sp. PtaB.Bin006]
MDQEFHFYIMYIVAQRAGYGPDESYTIAYSSQYTDDNTRKYDISAGTANHFENYISQTIDIMEPQVVLMRIYPVFHFMPGAESDLFVDSARRLDGKLHILNTIPNGSNSRKMMKDALLSGNPYRIGVAAHLHSDSFSHQNFLGFTDCFNSLLPGSLSNICHAEAFHKPDYVANVWHDKRLVSAFARVDNKRRVLQAAGNLYVFLKKGAPPSQKEIDTLVNDLGNAIGPRDDGNDLANKRVKRYKALIHDFKEYDKYAWFEKAVAEESSKPLPTPDYPPYPPRFTWQPGYQNSDWYKFQLAIMDHQKLTVDTILKPIFSGMDAMI